MEIERENKIQFWDNECIGKGSLRNQFPRIYAINQEKNMVVEEAFRGRIVEGSGIRM